MAKIFIKSIFSHKSYLTFKSTEMLSSNAHNFPIRLNSSVSKVVSNEETALIRAVYTDEVPAGRGAAAA